MDNEFKISSCVRGFSAKGCGRQDKQLNTYDYLAGIPGNSSSCELVEVQFKHTRKGYYRNDNHLPLEKGDMVAVEASPGHDIGVVTLTGQLVPLQMRKANLKPGTEIKRVYRKARPGDLEQYEAAKSLEQDTMIRSRKIAQELNLNMKIGDVEYQGDGNKAIFYYIADARVDFRQLIKVLAEAFRVRIEMKQIGARQEAGRIGGIGPCGRELCCATWMKNFNSVSTTAARFQDISPNPQKLAGQCAKLKCCLNYEVDTYVEAGRKILPRDVTLETADATYYLFKSDILAGLVTYSTDRRMAANLVTISVERAQAVAKMNKAGEKPATLDDSVNAAPSKPIDLVEQEDLHRFDKSKRRKNNNGKRRANGASKKEGENTKEAQADSARTGQPREKKGRDAQQRTGNPASAPNGREKNAKFSNGKTEEGKVRDVKNSTPNADGASDGRNPSENVARPDNEPKRKGRQRNNARNKEAGKGAVETRKNVEGRPVEEGRQPAASKNAEKTGNPPESRNAGERKGDKPAEKRELSVKKEESGQQNGGNKPQGNNQDKNADA